MMTGAGSIFRMPSRIAAVAGVTFTQLVRMRLFLVLAVFGIGFLALQFMPYQQHLGVEFRGVQQLQLIKDAAIGCMQLFSMVFCVGATALLIPRDTEDRILYTILSKPVPRFDYLTGKAAGVLMLLLSMLLFMDALMALLLWVRESSLTQETHGLLLAQGYAEEDIAPYLEQIHEAGNTWNTQRGIIAMFLGFGVLTSLTLLFSCFTSGTIVSMAFALGTYYVGLFQGQLFNGIAAGMGTQGTSPLAQQLERIVSVILPDFSLFAVADTASAGAPLPWGMLGSLALIALAYMLVHLLLSTWIFEHKEF